MQRTLNLDLDNVLFVDLNDGQNQIFQCLESINTEMPGVSVGNQKEYHKEVDKRNQLNSKLMLIRKSLYEDTLYLEYTRNFISSKTYQDVASQYLELNQEFNELCDIVNDSDELTDNFESFIYHTDTLAEKVKSLISTSLIEDEMR